MSIQLSCSGCHKKFRVPDHLAGRKGKCPECGGPISIAKTKPVGASPSAINSSAKDPKLSSLPKAKTLTPRKAQEPADEVVETFQAVPLSSASRAVPTTSSTLSSTSSSSGRSIMIIGGAAVLALVLVAVTIGAMTWTSDEPQVAGNQDRADDRQSAETKAPEKSTEPEISDEAPADGKLAGKDDADESASSDDKADDESDLELENDDTDQTNDEPPSQNPFAIPENPISPDDTAPDDTTPDDSADQEPEEKEPTDDPATEPDTEKPDTKDPTPDDSEEPTFEFPEDDSDDAPADGKDPQEKPSEKDGADKDEPDKDAADEDDAVAGPDDDLLPGGQCRVCYGTHHVPNRPLRPYVHVEGRPVPKPEQCVPWQYCPKCQQGRDPQELVDIEVARLARVGKRHLDWEALTKLKLVRVETHHVTIHAQFTPELALKQGQIAEAFTAYLQKTSRSVVFTPSRPDTFELYFAWDKPAYAKMISICQRLGQFEGTSDWGLSAQTIGFSGRLTAVNNALQARKTFPPEHVTVSSLAVRQINMATDYRAKTWLGIGFAYACERQMLSKNLVHYIDYQANETHLDWDWVKELKKYAGLNKLSPFDEIIDLELRSYEAPDHLTVFAMVSYLYSDPDRFIRLTMAIKAGQDDRVALQEVYGMSIAQLQKKCASWIARL